MGKEKKKEDRILRSGGGEGETREKEKGGRGRERRKEGNLNGENDFNS